MTPTHASMQAPRDSLASDETWFDRFLLNSPYEGSRVAMFAKVMLALCSVLMGLWTVGPG